MSSLSLSPEGLWRLEFPSLHVFNISDRRVPLLDLPSKDIVGVPQSGLCIFADACRRSISVTSFAVSSRALTAGLGGFSFGGPSPSLTLSREVSPLSEALAGDGGTRSIGRAWLTLLSNPFHGGLSSALASFPS